MRCRVTGAADGLRRPRCVRTLWNRISIGFPQTALSGFEPGYGYPRDIRRQSVPRGTYPRRASALRTARSDVVDLGPVRGDPVVGQHLLGVGRPVHSEDDDRVAVDVTQVG